jgi:FtsP/CotA-like multicopper oxidase with cupredoxin domain
MPSRRDLMKTGLVLGGALGVPRFARGQFCPPQGNVPTPASPPTTPFVWPMPIMPVAQPVDASVLNPGPDPSTHQRYNEFPPKKFYNIDVKAVMQKFHPDLPASVLFGYNGQVPGPTFHANYGEPLLIRFNNNLPTDHVGFGIPSISTHMHNFHTASESDGYPADFNDAGTYRDHHYCAFPAGNDPAQIMNTLWYHDHRQDFTAQNTYRGLTGFALWFDSLDSGNENDTNPVALRMPSGQFDVPMVFHDKVFDQNGLLYMDILNTDGILGDRYTVNGVIQPFFQVQPRKYRFRLLNGGPSRFYTFALSGGAKFVQCSNDGCLFPKPVAVNNCTIAVSERVDVIVDFSNFAGQSIYLLNQAEQLTGRGPSGNLLTPGDQVMRFDVGMNASPDNSQIPTAMRPLPLVDLTKVVKERLFRFDYFSGSWIVNGKVFDTNRIDADPRQGDSEIWTIRNEGRQWSHPIHIHFEEHMILSRNGVPIVPGSVENCRKDVIFLHPEEEVRVFFTFRDFLGHYPMHCHNTVHEDHAMMMRWQIEP